MRRCAAIASLVLLAGSTAGAIFLGATAFPQGVGVLGSGLLAVAAAWYGLRRRGLGRLSGLAAAGACAAGAIVLILVEGRPLAGALVLAGLVLATAAAGAAFRVKAKLPAVPAPRRPVLLFNPKSGGGKAETFGLAAEARRRGIEPIELGPADDLAELVESALTAGADALAAAGGDGSQAVVAAIAAERDVPFACIPAGTRNHFALDLGVDRDDVVGALDAFVDGGERRVDLAEVNGRVFVNNVSLGVYAEAVQREEYRGAKIRTLLDTVPDVIGPGNQEQAGVTLISNNRYRLGKALASGTRPHLDEGVLGVARIDARGRREEWAAPSYDVDGEGLMAAGIDGEAVKLEAPLRFRSLPAALRVRIARQHPGASPSARIPEHAMQLPGALARIVAGG